MIAFIYSVFVLYSYLLSVFPIANCFENFISLFGFVLFLITFVPFLVIASACNIKYLSLPFMNACD